MFTGKILLQAATTALLLVACAPTPGVFGTGEPNNDDGGATLPPNNGPGASGPGGTGGESTPPDSEGQPGGPWISFVNAEFKFGVDYPSNFDTDTKTAEQLSQLEPSPLAGFVFLSPDVAFSDNPDLEPSDLDLRVFDAKGAASLDGWLKSVGLLTEGVTSTNYRSNKASGVKVCASTMIFPGCSYFFLANGWAYQLIPASLIGEEMVATFTMLP
jgi:hypothetical protein